MFVCFFLTADKVGKTDFSGELEEEHLVTKGDTVGVGVVVAAAVMEQSGALFSPSSTALGVSLFRLFSALLLTKRGKERLDSSRALSSPSPAALGHSLFRLFPALSLAVQGEERVDSSRAQPSPSSAALGHSLFRLFPALSLAVQGEERLDFSRTLDSSKLPFRCIQCAAREGARTRLSSWVQPRHPKYLR